eukprot:TRINITY_DN31262_c0_g1_i1.p1 TRINITY_DN31262_c0_g1~~TRINITY_DN31262_c0_g1_i1.p1  ORF type:complete len:730 (+),score=101.17 TRINITY_DN31262_c0_g1_i1:44-2233(+)
MSHKKLVVYVSTTDKLLLATNGYLVINSDVMGWGDTIPNAGNSVAQDIVQTLSYDKQSVFKLTLVGKGIGGVIALSALSAMVTGWGTNLLSRIQLCSFIAIDTPFLGLPSYRGILSAKEYFFSDFGNTPVVLSQSSSSSRGISLLKMFDRRVAISTTKAALSSSLFIPPDNFDINLRYIKDNGIQLSYSVGVKPVPFSVMMLPKRQYKPATTSAVSEGATDPSLADEFIPDDITGDSTPRRRYSVAPAASEALCGMTHYSGLQDAHILRKRGEIKGQNISIKNCIGGSIHALDASGLVTITGCSNIQIVLGPVANSLLVDRCENCEIFAPTAGVIVRNCKGVKLSLYTLTVPILENSSKIHLSPFNVAMPMLNSLWSDAGITPNRENQFHTPSDLSQSDTSLLQPHFSIHEGNTIVHSCEYDDLKGEIPSFVAMQVADFQSNFTTSSKQPSHSPYQNNINKVFTDFVESHPVEWRPAPRTVEKVYKPDKELLFEKPFLSPLRSRAAAPSVAGMQADRWVNNVISGSVYRRQGDLNGGTCGITSCEASLIVLIDWQGSTSVTDCTTCTVVVAAAENCIISKCSDCSIFVCSGSIRVSGCSNIDLYSWTPRPILTEDCSSIRLYPWSLSLPNLTKTISLSGLELNLPNKWYEYIPATADCLVQQAATVVTDVRIQNEPDPCIPEDMKSSLSLHWQGTSPAINESLLTLNSLHWDKKRIEGPVDVLGIIRGQ